MRPFVQFVAKKLPSAGFVVAARSGIIFVRGKIFMEKHGAGALSILLLPANVRAFSCHLPHSAAAGRAL
jgi:hypothetical protein